MTLRWLDDIGPGDHAEVGGKAHVLARLRRAGLPVPNGFVVTPSFRDDAALASALASLPGPLAVRSSAAAEDGAEASFAGQFRTELDVAGAAAVKAAVERCRAVSATARDYARAMGLDPGESIPVLVQQFVEPVAAGVAFTRHPSDPAAMLVEARAGRGDALVSGLVSPDRYTIDRATSEVREGGGGCLDAAMLTAVTALARRAEALLGVPQDVEWAFAHGGLVLLQARPITVAAEAPLDPRVRHLTRANVGEVLPGPVSPLTATSVLEFLEHGFRKVATEAGILAEGAPPFLVVHDQHVYLNLTLCREIVAGLPGVSAADAERMVFGQAAADAVAAPRTRRWRSLARIPGRLLSLSHGLPARIEAAARAVDLMDEDEAGATFAAWDRLIALGHPVAVTHILTSGASAVKLAALSRLLCAVAPGDPADRVNRLTAGLDGIESTAPTVALEALGAECARHPEWRRWLESGPSAIEGAPVDLARELRAFLARFGHRGISEGELSARAWADDPAPVLESLAAFMRHRGIARAAAAERFSVAAQRIASARGLKVSIKRFHEIATAHCAPSLQELLSSSAVDLGHAPIRLPSGAGHDAQMMAQLCPSAMLFVRCRGGVSHNPAEFASVSDMGVAIAALIKFIERFQPPT